MINSARVSKYAQRRDSRPSFETRKSAFTANECLLLGPTPSLEPSFTFDGIRDTIEPLRKHQFDWPAGRRVSGKRSVVCWAILVSSDVRVVPAYKLPSQHLIM